MKENVKVYRHPIFSKDVHFMPKDELVKYVNNYIADYKYVTNIDINRPMNVCSTLNLAYELTNHIECKWLEDSESFEVVSSLSIGDILNYQGVNFVIAHNGYINMTTGEYI